MLLLELRPARIRAREAAAAEAVALLRDLGAEVAPGGPLSERKGIVWVTVPGRNLAAARSRFGRLGYSVAVDLLVAEDEAAAHPPGAADRSVRWRRRAHRLVRLYEEDPVDLRERAPDRREFLFATRNGPVRPVRGYRGSEGPLTHRALPVPDARLLTNLVATGSPGLLLDPFAGAGGVVIEALAAGWRVVSIDDDPAVRLGLAHLGALHIVADARRIPLADASVGAVSTEPPYDERAGELVVDALHELGRVVAAGGRIAMLCARWQARELVRASIGIGLVTELETPIDRKGVEVTALVWRR